MANLPDRNNNPGNLRDPASGNFRTFASPDEGYAALLNDLDAKMSGASSTGINGKSTLYDLSSVYAPKSDNNDPAQYAANLANTLGVRPDTPIGQLAPRIGEVAQAFAKNEGFTQAKGFSAGLATGGAEEGDPTTPGFLKSMYQGLVGPVVNLAVAPYQAAMHYGRSDLATGKQIPGSGSETPIEGTAFGNLPGVGDALSLQIHDPYAQIQRGEKTPGQVVESAVGQGIQAVGLGLGPVAGGAALMGGSALERNMPVLPTMEHPFDNALVQATAGGVFGKAGDIALTGAGKGIALLGKVLETAPYADKLIQSAVKNWENILAPTTKATKTAVQSIAPELADRGEIFTSRNDIAAIAEQRASHAGDIIDTIWNAVPEGTMLNARPIAESIFNQMKTLLVPLPGGRSMLPEENRAAFQALDTKGNELLSLMDKKGMAEVNSLRAWRQSGDKFIQQAKPFQFAAQEGDRAKVAATKTATNAARKTINESNPELAKANKEYHLWDTTKDVMDATLLRKTGQRTPLTETLNQGFGLVAGAGTGGVSHAISAALLLKYATKLWYSTLIQSASASVKVRLAKAIESGETSDIFQALQFAVSHGGKALQFIGDFLSGLPKAAREVPHQNIPGTSAEEIKNKVSDFVDDPKLGLSMQNVEARTDSKTGLPLTKEGFIDTEKAKGVDSPYFDLQLRAAQENGNNLARNFPDYFKQQAKEEYIQKTNSRREARDMETGTALEPGRASGSYRYLQDIVSNDLKKPEFSPINDATPAKDLNARERSIENEAFAKLKENPAVAVKEYEAIPESMGGKVANADIAKKIFADVGYQGSNSRSVQEPASALTKVIYRQGLKKEGDVALFAGGSGTGKTSAIESVAPDVFKKSAVVLDGNLSSIKSATDRIKEAQAAGKKVDIYYVYREPVDSFDNGVVKRMLTNKEEGGRVVPSSVVAGNHISSYNVVGSLIEKVSKGELKNVRFHLIDNSLGAGNQKEMSIQKFFSLEYPEVEDLRSSFVDAAKKRYEKGEISKTQFDELSK